MALGLEVADPGAYGFSPARLARIDAFLRDRYLSPGLLPHAQLLVARDGVPVHFFSEGAALEGGPAVDEASLFRIASMTKPVTSIAFMMLLERGLVALDTPVHHVLPEFKGVGVYAGGGAGVPFVTRPTDQPMRMVDLLRHTAGLTYTFQNRTNVDAAYRELGLETLPGAEHDLDGFVRILGTIPLEFSPGTSWNYSVATDVLGAVVERVSGEKLDAFFARHIFEPLGMRDTFFQVPADKVHRLTDCHAMHPRHGRVPYDRGADSRWAKPVRFLSGGGGLVSTALDYHRFTAALLNGGAPLVGRKTLDLMVANHIPGGGDLAGWSKSLFSEAANAGTGFGLGFAVNLDPARSMMPGSAGEYYWGGMFSTAFFIDPVERLTMVFMTQLSPSSTYPVRREIKTMIYAALT